MAQSCDYSNKPIIFCACFMGNVTASTTVPKFTFVLPADMYLDRISMTVGASGINGNTEVSVSKNTVATLLFSTNTLQIAATMDQGYETITRTSLNSTGLSRLSRGDRLLVCVRERPNTTSQDLTITIVGMGA